MQKHIFESIINAEYELSDALELEDFLYNPSPEALSAALTFSLSDGLAETICDADGLESAVIRAHKTKNFEALGREIYAACIKRAELDLENIDMDDIKGEDVVADHIAVDNISRMRDLG